MSAVIVLTKDDFPIAPGDGRAELISITAMFED
jgi:hypothetical protein